jgi:hypothetical protein
MATFNQNDVLLNIQQLIDKSRCGIDGFFTDSKTAAKDILTYLETENIINKNEHAVEIRFNEGDRVAA